VREPIKGDAEGQDKLRAGGQSQRHRRLKIQETWKQAKRLPERTVGTRGGASTRIPGSAGWQGFPRTFPCGSPSGGESGHWEERLSLA